MIDQSLLSKRSGSVSPTALDQLYEYEETRDLVALVNAAAELLAAKGESAFGELRVPGSRWLADEKYVFVLDPAGTMLVHPDAELEGTNQLDLEDIAGKPVVRGLLDAATMFPDRTEGWYHYQWVAPGGLLPRWKSSFVRQVKLPSGRTCIVAAGMYDDRMERAFVVDLVDSAVAAIEKEGRAAFERLRDPKGPFFAKDAYVFVNLNGVELVNPGFPSLEGRNILDITDMRGKRLMREIIDVVRERGSGWVDYMWPKPGESVSTQKSAYVRGAKLEDALVVVGCGVYLADAPREVEPATRMTAPELMALVREGAAILGERGEEAYSELGRRGSKWFRDDTYFFVLSMDGTAKFHAADPDEVGNRMDLAKDVLGRPFGKMFLDTAATPSGEGWVHYLYPKPGNLFPAWKSAFVKRVTFPSGERHVVGCGVYNMKMDRAFIEDVVGRAAALVAERGAGAFDALRDPTGAFVFMDTYVFVDATDGTELVNPAQPSLEGRNLIDLEDVEGKAVVREEIAEAIRSGSAWLECHWWKPGTTEPARKETYVRKVRSGADSYIVGSGIYVD